MIQSPCVAKCGLNEEDICMGCYRHIDEIVAWGSADDGYKAGVLEKLSVRKNNFDEVENNRASRNTSVISRQKWQEAEARLENSE